MEPISGYFDSTGFGFGCNNIKRLQNDKNNEEGRRHTGGGGGATGLESEINALSFFGVFRSVKIGFLVGYKNKLIPKEKEWQ